MKTQILKPGQWLAFIALALMGTFPTDALAQNTLTWDQLGTQVVDFTLDRDVVKASGSKSYTSLKIKVNNGTVNILKVTVHFANGDTQNIDLPKELTKDNDGKLIDLVGNKRVIEKVTFWYDTKNSDNNKAVVEVWARS